MHCGEAGDRIKPHPSKRGYDVHTSPLVVQKSPEELIYGEYHSETRVTEWGTTWDAQVSTQKVIRYVNPPTLSSTASSSKSMDLSARPTTSASIL
ncbi:hypothetical protein [Nostoc sp.]|uniref:hypothetical protein n=1 Tax=Nostoc sp. TaxID=1180 RepID=UPI002FF07D05